MRNNELDYLENSLKALPDNAKIVEWGSGGSTLWFLKQLKDTQFLYSIEHNPEWYSIVSKKLKEQPKKNYSYTMFKLNVDIDFYKFATPNEEMACGLDHYINPKFDIWDSDLFL